jgi:hypothetical protein
MQQYASIFILCGERKIMNHFVDRLNERTIQES